MSTFINNDITSGGRILLAKGQLGQRLEFTRIVMGDGYLPPNTAIRDMTAVVNPIVNVPITKKKMNADGTVIIGGGFSNADILTEFFYRELALFAKGEDGNEILYCYGNAGNFAERITPVGGSSIIEKTIDIVTAIGTAANVTAHIVRTTNADEISFDDSKVKLGAGSIQEAIEILTKNANNIIAQNVLLDVESDETVADALTRLNNAKVYALTELSAHTSNADIHVNAAQMANHVIAIGELIKHAENGALHLATGDKSRWDTSVATAAEALTVATQASEITNQHENRITRLEEGLFSNITGNPFLISFDNLTGIQVTKGIWNKAMQRIEC